MTEKNRKQESVRTELLKGAGCSVVMIPAILFVLFIFASAGIFLFQLYFYGNTMADVRAFQDPVYLLTLGAVVFTTLLVLNLSWRGGKSLYRTFNRYRRLRAEASRIDRLELHENELRENEKPKPQSQADDIPDWLHELDDESQQQMKS